MEGLIGGVNTSRDAVRLDHIPQDGPTQGEQVISLGTVLAGGNAMHKYIHTGIAMCVLRDGYSTWVTLQAVCSPYAQGSMDVSFQKKIGE